MDKTKVIAIAILLAVGGFFVLNKAQDPLKIGSVVPHDHDGDGVSDHGEEGHENEGAETPAKPQSDVSGGVTKLKIEDIRKGDGAVAKAGDDVQVNYRGTLINGEMFDQSYGRGPFDFKLGTGGVIKGWDEGVAGMKVGGKRKLTIPADMGYGAQGSPPKIPGGATLLFDVELLKVNGKG